MSIAINVILWLLKVTLIEGIVIAICDIIAFLLHKYTDIDVWDFEEILSDAVCIWAIAALSVSLVAAVVSPYRTSP